MQCRRHSKQGRLPVRLIPSDLSKKGTIDNLFWAFGLRFLANTHIDQPWALETETRCKHYLNTSSISKAVCSAEILSQ